MNKPVDQIKNWRWDNTCTSGDQVDHSNLQTTCSGKVNHTCKHFTWYGSDDLSVKIVPPSCRQYKPGDFLAMRPMKWNEMTDDNEDVRNWVDCGAPSGAWCHPSDGNDNDDRKGDEDTQGSEKGT